MIQPDGIFDDLDVKMRPIETGSSLADVGAHLGAALAGSSRAGTALTTWSQAQSLVDPDLVEAISGLRHAWSGITEPEDLIAQATELFRELQISGAEQEPL